MTDISDHRIVAAVRVSFVASVAVGLEGLIAAPSRFATPGIEINGAGYCSGGISDPLALRHRILMHPIHTARLYRYHLPAQIYVAARPYAAWVDLCYDLTAKHR